MAANEGRRRNRRNRRSRRKAAADCRRGIHRYGSAHAIGGGMTRQTCSACGAVSIDVTQAEAPLEVALFGPSSRRGRRR